MLGTQIDSKTVVFNYLYKVVYFKDNNRYKLDGIQGKQNFALRRNLINE